MGEGEEGKERRGEIDQPIYHPLTRIPAPSQSKTRKRQGSTIKETKGCARVHPATADHGGCTAVKVKVEQPRPERPEDEDGTE